MTKYKVVGKNGKEYSRKSDRVYTHVIVRHWKAYDYESWKGIVHVPAGSAAYSWCGRPDLVKARVAEAWKRSHTSDVEVIAIADMPNLIYGFTQNK